MSYKPKECLCRVNGLETPICAVPCPDYHGPDPVFQPDPPPEFASQAAKNRYKRETRARKLWLDQPRHRTELS